MLRSLHLKDVGPAARFDLELGERLNVLTGDNGLGKSFVLDVAWWALTGTWIGKPVLPRPGQDQDAMLSAEIGDANRKIPPIKSWFNRQLQLWSERFESRYSTNPDVRVPAYLPDHVPVLYVRADGGFSVWDPARSHSIMDFRTGAPVAMPEAYHFGPGVIWEPLMWGGKPVCNGLIQDWSTWQLEAKDDGRSPFHILQRVLLDLSHPAERMEPGKPARLYLDDIRKIPTIELPYGEVPVTQASSAMQRILGLSYLIAWAWTEHVTYCGLRGWEPANRFVLLLDEAEMHLHPKWQRHITPALLTALKGLGPKMRPQVLMTTHSPMVMASIEPHIVRTKDKLFLFELEGTVVSLRELPWFKAGDAVSWLTSHVFGLEQARSIEAERAIKAAYDFMAGRNEELPPELRTEDAIHRELTRVLPDQDPFWPRWIVTHRERHG